MTPSPPFHPSTQRWFADRVGTPTDVQSQAWPLIHLGGNVLATAPTGTGKTLAAFLVALDRLLTGEWTGGGLRVLYLSPLKALNNDVQRNVLAPLQGLTEQFRADGLEPPTVRVLVRSGDTPESERRQLRKRAPEILITTPESLNILLTQKSAPLLFGGLKAVIVDEIHAVAGTKRGTSLMTALERLVPWAGEFQRIGLSATVNPPDLMARYLAGLGREGQPRPVATVVSSYSKQYDVKVCLPEFESDPETGKVFWESLALDLRKTTRVQASTLIFTNSRRACEKLARLINAPKPGDEPELIAYSHHGSLSKDLRLEVEQKLKAGQIRALVATNSLELGIDIGELDEVVLAQTPRSAASAIQKVGRAGHTIGAVSRARLYPSHGLDLVEAAVITRCIREQTVEPLVVPEAPLDVLAQTILSMLCCEALSAEEVFARVRGAWPYRNLTPLAFGLVLDLLQGRYEGTRLKDLKPRIVSDPVSGLLSARDEVPFLLFSSGGMIPDRGYFTLRDQASGARLGELDEEFVWERQLGDRFAFGPHVWRIAAVTDTSVEVVPVPEKSDNIPFWIAEDQDRSWFLAEKIGEFLEGAERQLAADPERLKRELIEVEGFSTEAAKRMLAVLSQQRAFTGTLPHRHCLVAEVVTNAKAGHPEANSTQIILHNFWGARVNRPWAFALAQAWEDLHGAGLELWAGDDQVLILVPPEADPQDFLALVTPENLEGLLRRRLESTGFFGARFRESAGRALLLPKSGFGKRQPLWMTRLRAKSLMAAVLKYADFPILVEAWRQCLHDEFDLPSLRQLLDEVATGAVRLHVCRTADPSPFTDGLLWKQVSEHMYAGDALEGGQRSQLDDEVWKTVLSGELPALSPQLVSDWEARLQQLRSGYAPETAEEALDLLELRVALPLPEWQALLKAGSMNEKDFAGRVVLDRSGPRAPERVLVAAWQPLLAEPLPWLSRWLEWYGPQPVEAVRRFWNVDPELWTHWLDGAIQEELVVVGRLRTGATEDELCLRSHWESLARRQRQQRRTAVVTRPAAQLPGFLATWQGLVHREQGPEALQRRLGQLLGLPLPAALWEAAVLPCRLDPYWPASLDNLLAETGLAWFGAGREEVLFGFAEDKARLGLARPTQGEEAELLALFGNRSEAEVGELASSTRQSTSAVTEKLWSLAWKGLASGTRFEVLRRGLASKFTFDANPGSTTSARSASRGFQRWSNARSGSIWRSWSDEGSGVEIDTEDDRVAALEDAKARARLVLERYGIVCRELLALESPPFQWKALFPALKLMELSGEISAGRFFEGPLGLQFASQEALRTLELDAVESSGGPALFIQHAQDPSSLCGRGVETGHPLPRRAAGTWLWWSDSQLAGVVSGNGKRLDLFLEPGDETLPMLTRRMAALLWAGPTTKAFWTLETLNGVPVADSPRAPEMKEAGFRWHGNRLLLMKHA